MKKNYFYFLLISIILIYTFSTCTPATNNNNSTSVAQSNSTPVDNNKSRIPSKSTQWKMVLTPNSYEEIAFAVIGTNIFAGSGNHLFLSSDTGKTWTCVINGLHKSIYSALAVSGTNIFAGNDSGIFLSTDTGKRWKNVSKDLVVYDSYWGQDGLQHRVEPEIKTPLAIMSLAVCGTNIIADAEGDDHVYLSSDEGGSWTRVYNFPYFGFEALNARIFATIGTNIFAGPGPIYLSTNNGASWKELSAHRNYIISSTNNAEENWRAYASGDSNYGPDAVVLAVIGKNVFASGHRVTPNGPDYGLFLSTDLGSSWTKVSKIFNSNDLCVSSFAINGTDIFAGGPGVGVILATDNGSNWMAVNEGLYNSGIHSLAICGSYIFAGSTGDNPHAVFRRSLSEIYASPHPASNY